jgi:hypothetical protein
LVAVEKAFAWRFYPAGFCRKEAQRFHVRRAEITRAFIDACNGSFAVGVFVTLCGYPL